MRLHLLAMTFGLVSAVARDSKKTSGPVPTAAQGSAAPTAAKRPRAPLTDITTASKLDAVRTAFNAHKGEARFLTLLSPT